MPKPHENPPRPTIPLFRPSLPAPGLWWESYEQAQASGQLTNFGRNFERARGVLAELFGGHWLPCSTGTAALELALVAKLPRGSRVLVPDFTFTATINAVVRAGMKPVIGACEPERLTYPADEFLLRWPLHRIDAIVVVAPFGYDAHLEEWEDIARTLGKPLIADLAGAFPLVLKKSTAAYSLHAAKSLAIGEGGLVRFECAEEYERAKRFANFDFVIDPRTQARIPFSVHGTNAKLDELRCALLLGQLKRYASGAISREILARMELCQRYEQALDGEGVYLPTGALGLHSHPSICALMGFAEPDDLVATLDRSGIVARRYYHPLLSASFPELPRLGQSHPQLQTVVALPSRVEESEFASVVRVVLSHQKKIREQSHGR